MASVALIKYYARLIQKKRMTMEEIDPELRDDVQKAIEGVDFTTPMGVPIAEESLNEANQDTGLLGAMTVPTYEKYISLNEDGKFSNGLYHIQCDINLLDVFNDEVLGDLEMPQNISIATTIIENLYGFLDGVSANITLQDNVIKIDISAEGVNETPEMEGFGILMIHFILASFNYEPIRFTVSLKAH